ncbi:MAG: PDZ domain-containing protein [Actinomycetota bacterium]
MSDAPAQPTADGTRRRRRRALVLRSAFYASTVAIVAAAAFTVPLPFIEFLPADPTEIPPLVEIEGTQTTELDGETALLTILLRQQPTVPAIGALLDEDRQLRPLNEVYPPGTEREQLREVERERFGRAFDVAAVVGAQAAGVDAELVTEVAVVQVIPDSPAEGLLDPGDIIVEVNGERVTAAEGVQRITREGEIGERIELAVRRAGESDTDSVTAELADVSGDGTPALGVLIETAVDDLRLPFEVTLAEDTRIGGPSAGLMIGLTVYDLLSDEDLLDGRTVMGTGTLDADGRVGPVGGVPEKIRAVAEHGADLVLVPRSQLDEARAAAPDELNLVGVSDLDEALEVLRDGDG